MTNDRRPCPYCAEPILLAAKVCPHCRKGVTTGDKLTDAGSKIQRLGCALTLLITVPILLLLLIALFVG
jgi:hypothetical protein